MPPRDHARLPQASAHAGAEIGEPARGLGVALQRQAAAQAVAQRRAERRTPRVVECVHTVLVAQEAGFDGVVGQSRSQQPCIDVERHRRHHVAPERILDDDHGLPCARDGRRRIEHERPAPRLPAELAHVVDIQIHGGRHGRAGAQQRQRIRDEVRRRSKLRCHCTPPSLTARLQPSAAVTVSPRRSVVSRSGSACDQLVSRRV